MVSLMKKFKIAFITLLVMTLTFIGVTAYCYVKGVVFEPKPFVENGVYHDPSSSAYIALRLYRTFLRWSPIGLTVLTVLWIALVLIEEKQTE